MIFDDDLPSGLIECDHCTDAMHEADAITLGRATLCLECASHEAAEVMATALSHYGKAPPYRQMREARDVLRRCMERFDEVVERVGREPHESVGQAP